MCLHSCQFLPLGGSTYFPAFSAACSVLELLLLNHTETVLKSIPSYLGCAKSILLSILAASFELHHWTRYLSCVPGHGLNNFFFSDCLGFISTRMRLYKRWCWFQVSSSSRVISTTDTFHFFFNYFSYMPPALKKLRGGVKFILTFPLVHNIFLLT